MIVNIEKILQLHVNLLSISEIILQLITLLRIARISFYEREITVVEASNF